MGRAFQVAEGAGAAQPHRGAPQRVMGILVAALVVVLIGNAIPGPLLPHYQARWGLSPLATTSIFAVYAVGVIAAVVFAGRIADQIGARPVIVAAITCSALAGAVAVLAPDVVWLYLARIVQGVAAGLVGGAATAAITQVNRDPAAAARWAAVGTTTGIASGLLLAGVVGQIAGHVLIWPWIVDLALLVAAGLAMGSLDGALVPRRRPRLTVTPPGLPPTDRTEFFAALAGVSLVFACMGLFAGLGPSIALAVGVHGILGQAAVAALAYVLSGLIQLTIGARVTRARPGLLVLIAGLAVLVIAVHTGSPPWLFAAAALIGLGNGLAFPVTLATVNRLAPAARRAEIVSTYNIAMYCGVVIPLLATALIADAASLRTASAIVAAAIAVGAVALAVLEPAEAPRPRLRPSS